MNTMFCGEYQGELCTAWMGHGARDLRRKIAREIFGGPGNWAYAKKEGWRVVRVSVMKINRRVLRKRTGALRSVKVITVGPGGGGGGSGN